MHTTKKILKKYYDMIIIHMYICIFCITTVLLICSTQIPYIHILYNVNYICIVIIIFTQLMLKPLKAIQTKCYSQNYIKKIAFETKCIIVLTVVSIRYLK